MDQKRICTLIQELLIRNERVLLPKVGELSVQSTSAAFMQDGKTILPPGKKLLFKSDAADGECELWQKELSGKIQEAFAQHREYAVPGVGIFSMDTDGNAIFTADKNFDFAPDNFTLEAISLEVNEVGAIPQQESEESGETETQVQNEVEDQHLETKEAVEQLPEEAQPKPMNEHEAQPEPASMNEPEVQPEHQNAAPQAEEVEQPVATQPGLQKKQTPKWVMWIVAAVAVLALLIILAVVFRENLKPLLENMLYSKEELEIIQKWAAQ